MRGVWRVVKAIGPVEDRVNSVLCIQAGECEIGVRDDSNRSITTLTPKAQIISPGDSFQPDISKLGPTTPSLKSGMYAICLGLSGEMLEA